MPAFLLACDVVFGAFAIYLLVKLVRQRINTLAFPLPPGPRKYPLIGNLLDMPKGAEGPHWAKHKALYGPISSVKVFGSTFIIVNDVDIATELLDRRSRIYSSRQCPTFVGEMVGWGPVLTLVQYGKHFNMLRKQMSEYIGTQAAINRLDPIKEVESRRLLLSLLQTPDKFPDHIKTTVTATVLKLSHGYTIEPEGHDVFVDLAERTMEGFSAAAQAGSWTVDVLPFLRHLPEWLPGMEFKRLARKWRACCMDTLEKPFAFVQHQQAAGKALSSYVSDRLEKGYSSYDVQWTAMALYAAGSDTTATALMYFILAMVLYPDVLRRAQDEVDHVIGNERLPVSADRSKLPYIDAVVKETLRWQSIVPVGVPHRVEQDDIYRGYFIPKDAIVVPIVWQMAHDEENYRDAVAFKPERYFGVGNEEGERDPRAFVFGFGRRICPGKELADSSLFIAIAMLIATFNITKAKDFYGREIIPVVECSPGLVSHPAPFKCSITPRSEKAVALIKSVEEEHPFERGDSDVLSKL